MKVNGLETTKDVLKDTVKAVQRLTQRQVLVGIPQAAAAREGDVNNAMLGYVHEFGLPARGIPARPHLVPGVRKASPAIVTLMKVAGQTAMAAGSRGLTYQQRNRLIDQALTKVGILCVNSVKTLIRAGIPPPLARATLLARARRKVGGGVGIRKGARREAGLVKGLTAFAQSPTSTTPLIDTGLYWNAITFVLDTKGAMAPGVSSSAEKLGIATEQTIIGPSPAAAPIVGEQPEAP